MPREIEKLTALRAKRLNKPGLYADGGGLYLQVTSTSAKSWLYRFTLHGRTRDMGLGSFATVSLAEARAEAGKARKVRHSGFDPIERRMTERAALRLAAATEITFKQCAADYMKAHSAGWRNAKHKQQWENTLATYAEPVIGTLPVASIDTPLVLKVLQPIWSTKTETATRLRGRLEVVLDWAKVHGYRKGENPARWRGHLDKLLARPSRIQKVKHHPALPYRDIPKLMAVLRQQEGTAARALEFLILTAARTGEVIGARRGELDGQRKSWIVPAERMKAAREHRVPLSTRGWAIASSAIERDPDFLFPGRRARYPISSMAMTMLLRRTDYSGITVHGFRSSFRDWAAECTNHPREVVEMALAHTISDETESAYFRSDLFERRRELMNDWAKFCQSRHKGTRAVSNYGRRSPDLNVQSTTNPDATANNPYQDRAVSHSSGH